MNIRNQKNRNIISYKRSSNILLEYTITVNSAYGIVYLGDYYMVNPLERENFDIKENKIIKLPGFAILSFCLI